jgi:mRNA interferase RelE/StbE
VKIEFRKSFERDLRKIKDGATLQRIQAVVEAVESVKSLSDLSGIKKLKAEGSYYRIRVGDYRIGLSLNGDILVFVRLLPRREIYRYFP